MREYRQSILSTEGFPASPSPWQESKKGKPTTDISGLNFRAWSKNLDLVGSSLKTYLASCELPPMPFARTWSASVTQSGFGILKLRLSALYTAERESSLWRTPKAQDPDRGPHSETGIMKRIANGQTIRLQDQVNHPALFRTPDAGCARGAQSADRFVESMREGRLLTLNDQIAHLWPTPIAGDAGSGMMVRTSGRPIEKSTHLAAQVYCAAMFPTPRSADADKGQRTPEGAVREANRGHGIDLPCHVQMFPTPTINGNYNKKGASPGAGDGLETFVKLYPTPTANDAKNNAPPSQRTENGRHTDQLNVVAKGALNPSWVEWLMGLPLGWTDIGE